MHYFTLKDILIHNLIDNGVPEASELPDIADSKAASPWNKLPKWNIPNPLSGSRDCGLGWPSRKLCSPSTSPSRKYLSHLHWILFVFIFKLLYCLFLKDLLQWLIGTCSNYLCLHNHYNWIPIYIIYIGNKFFYMLPGHFKVYEYIPLQVVLWFSAWFHFWHTQSLFSVQTKQRRLNRLLCLAKYDKHILHFQLVKSRSIVKNGKIF